MIANFQRAPCAHVLPRSLSAFIDFTLHECRALQGLQSASRRSSWALTMPASSVSALLPSPIGEGRRRISCCRAAILRHLDQASRHDSNASSRGCLGAERLSLHLCDVTPDYEAFASHGRVRWQSLCEVGGKLILHCYKVIRFACQH